MAVTPEYTALCDSARQMLRSGSYSQAIALFEQARQIDDLQVPLFEGLGTACFLAGQDEAAIAHFNRVIALAPRRGAAYINLGAIYNRKGDYQKAIETLRRGIQLEARSAEGYYNLAIAHRRLKQLALAVPAYREAIRLDPQMAEAYQNLGNVYLEMGNHQQAIAHFTKALEIKPNFERAARGLKRAEEAVLAAKKAVNPFGRLVGALPPDGNERAAAMAISQRTLDPDERLADRKQVNQLLSEIQERAKRLLEHVRHKLEPGLRELNRAVIEHSGNTAQLQADRKKFKPHIYTYESLTHKLAEAVAELRTHEAQMNRDA